MSLRAITLPEGAEVGRIDVPEGGLAWVEIAWLRIDDSYQRPLSPKNWQVIRKMARGFRWAYFQPVMIAPVGDGAFAVIDGQHRVHAARLAGADRVPAMVVDVPASEQAAAFAAINGQRTAVTAFHLLKAALAAGETWAVEADAAVAAAGCRLMTYNKSSTERRPREIFLPAMIRKHVQAGRGRLVTRGLTLLRGALRADEPALWSDRIIGPWFDYLRDAAATDAELRGYLAATDLIRLRGTVGDLRRAPEYAAMTDRALMVRVLDVTVKKHVTGRRAAA